MAGRLDDRLGLRTKFALVVTTTLLLLSGAALAGREDTIEANRDLLRQRVDQGRAVLLDLRNEGDTVR